MREKSRWIFDLLLNVSTPELLAGYVEYTVFTVTDKYGALAWADNKLSVTALVDRHL